MQTFWTHGFTGTSVPLLASATGLGPGSLYAAYGNKESMFQFAIKQYVQYLDEAFVTDAKGVDGIEALFNTIVRLTAEDPQRRGCLIINAVPEMEAMSGSTQKRLKDGLADFRSRVQQYLEHETGWANDRGGLSLKTVAANIAASSIGIRTLGKAGLPRAHLQSIADASVAFVRERLK